MGVEVGPGITIGGGVTISAENAFSPALKTNWTGSGFNTTTPDYGAIDPQQGDGMHQSNGNDAGSLSNNISSTWYQYTIEGWIYVPAANNSTRRIQIGTNGQIQIIFQSSASPDNLLISAAYTGPGALGPNQIGQGSGFQTQGNWFYWTFVKVNDSNRFTMINGTRVGAVNTNTFTEIIDTTSSTALSTLVDSPTSDVYLFDMIRISNVARYTADQTFTPPTTAFTNDVNTWFLDFWDFPYNGPEPSPT